MIGLLKRTEIWCYCSVVAVHRRNRGWSNEPTPNTNASPLESEGMHVKKRVNNSKYHRLCGGGKKTIKASLDSVSFHFFLSRNRLRQRRIGPFGLEQKRPPEARQPLPDNTCTRLFTASNPDPSPPHASVNTSQHMSPFPPFLTASVSLSSPTRPYHTPIPPPARLSNATSTTAASLFLTSPHTLIFSV